MEEYYRNMVIIYVSKTWDRLIIKNPQLDMDSISSVDDILECVNELTKRGSEFEKFVYRNQNEKYDWFFRHHGKLSDTFFEDLTEKYFNKMYV